MSPADVAAVRDAGPVAPSAAQARIITAALDLFARHGVGGTSLQMIADEIGVTKAAVYHQYKTKDEIVLAAAEAELARLEAVIDAAEAEPSRKRARDALDRRHRRPRRRPPAHDEHHPERSRDRRVLRRARDLP